MNNYGGEKYAFMVLSVCFSVGIVRIPTTTNAIERFFRAFNRFYKVRCGFFSVLSASRIV
jgi:hypothetical protein